MPQCLQGFQGLTARILLLALLVFLVPAGVLWSAEVPRYQDVTGHAFGERITTHADMVRYLERLAATSPRVKVVNQGKSWEERDLLLAIVTSPENHARLAEIQRDAQRLGDPRKISSDEAAALAARQPVIVWYGGSIHGFELSGTEGILKLLERLTTADDAETREVLEKAVVLIDPMLNPDGRDAFAALNHRRLGAAPNPQRDDWSNDFTPWDALSFRTGHYLFDTNRDWFAQTQRETRARAVTLQAWRPQIMVDAHEQGPDAEFYFDPAAEPYGPFFPAFARRWFDRFGQAYAKAFDAAGFEYMTRERYNYFYPGYTTSYSSYQGGVGMLFEQGSTRGLALTRPDETVRTLADALEQQYTAAWTAVRLAATERERLLREYHEGQREAVESGRRGIARYLITPEGDPHLAAELADLLRRSGADVGVLSEEATVSGVRDREGKDGGGASRRYPAGTYVVETAQPRSALIRALLEPDLPLPKEFLEQARARILRDENPEFYDITSWSLPLLWNVSVASTTDRRNLPLRAEGTQPTPTFEMPASRPAYAYVIDGRQTAAPAALYHLKARGHRAGVLLKPTRIGGRDYASGSVIVRVGQNEAGVHDTVRELASKFHLRVSGVESGHSEVGFPSLGTGDMVNVRMPEVALLGEHPIQGYSFGWAWYVLDRQYEIPVTVRRVRSLANTPLHRHDVLVIPEVISAELLEQEMGQAGVDRLKQWVRDGGTLIALGSAVDFVREKLQLTGLRSWYDEQTKGGKEGSPPKEEPQRLDVPGAILRASLDTNTWLATGYGGELPVLVNSERIYLAPKGPASSGKRVVARYAPKDRLRISGHIWPETLERLPEAVFAYEERIGQGRVIAFAEDLNFRGFWRGSDRLFLNAVVMGPSAP